MPTWFFIHPSAVFPGQLSQTVKSRTSSAPEHRATRVLRTLMFEFPNTVFGFQQPCQCPSSYLCVTLWTVSSHMWCQAACMADAAISIVSALLTQSTFRVWMHLSSYEAYKLKPKCVQFTTSVTKTRNFVCLCWTDGSCEIRLTWTILSPHWFHVLHVCLTINLTGRWHKIIHSSARIKEIATLMFFF